MTNIVIVMDMNIGFAKRGSLFSLRTEKLIQPIADFCRESFEEALETGLTEALKLIPDFVHLGSKSDLFS